MKDIKQATKKELEIIRDIYAEDSGGENTKIVFMCEDSVLMVIPKQLHMAEAMKKLYDSDEDSKEPQLDYQLTEMEKKNGEVITGFSPEYFKTALRFMKTSDETPKLRMKTNYPFTFENEYFKVIIAPRVESD